jgi:hypothetical protein
MTMLPPDAVDDVDASGLVIEAERAAEIVNRARAMVQRRSGPVACPPWTGWGQDDAAAVVGR